MLRSLAALLLGLVLLGNVGADAATLRIGLQDDPDTMDPALSGSFVARVAMAGMCDTLIDVDQKLNYIPSLATSWQWSADGRALTMHLRQGITFQNGEPFNADAVKWNITRYQTMPASRRVAELKPVAGVNVLDPEAVRFDLSHPYAPLLSVLADRPGMMLAPKASAAEGANVAAHPVCLGPYEFVRRMAQDRIVLQRAANYWDPSKQGFDEVDYVTMPDPSVRLSNLRAGALDLIERVAPTDLPTIRSDTRLRIVSSVALGYSLLSINVGNGPMAQNPLGQNPLVREAFEDSIDRDALNQVVFSGAYIPDSQPEAPNSPYYDPDFPTPPRDVAKAKALLQQAGVPHPTFTLLVPNDPINGQVAQVLQSMADEAGFDMKLQVMDGAALTGQAQAGNYQMTMNIWSGRPDPDQNVSIWLACDGFLDRGKYCNPSLDKLLAAASATNDATKRAALYRQAAAIYLKDRPFLFLYHYTWLWGTTAKLQGFTPYPDGVIRLNGMHFAK
jgi:peptide/nickel transport system substrate-binding protein